MNLEYYKQILAIFPEKPDLRNLQEYEEVPEGWPFLLKAILNKNERLLMFEVEDLNISLVCKTYTTDMIEKVSSMEEGQIIFLYDSVVTRNRLEKSIELDVGYVYSLKEVHDGLATNHKKKILAQSLRPRDI